MLHAADPRSAAGPTPLPPALPGPNAPVRLDDLPRLLSPYARSAPVYVYLMRCGNVKATRIRLKDDEDLILVLSPRPASRMVH